VFRCRWYDLKSELDGLAAETSFCPLLGLFVVSLKDGLVVGLMGFEQVEDDSRQLVRSCRDCLGRPEFAFHSPVKFAQVIVGMV